MRRADPAGPALPAELAHSVGFVLGKAAQRAAAMVEQALQPFGLKARHYGVLVTLQDRGAWTQRQVGDLLAIDRTTMAAIVDDLERLGLAERRPHPSSRRAHALQLTARGRELLPTLVAMVASAERDLLASIEEHDRRTLFRLLARLVDLPVERSPDVN